MKLKYLVAGMASKWISESEVNSTFFNIYPALFLCHLSLMPHGGWMYEHAFVPLFCYSALKSYKPLNCSRFPFGGGGNVSVKSCRSCLGAPLYDRMSYDWMLQVKWVNEKKNTFLTKSSPVLWSEVIALVKCQMCFWQKVE